MQGEIDTLRAEVAGLKSKLDEDEPDEKPTKPRMCCRAMTAEPAWRARLVYRWKNFAKIRNTEDCLVAQKKRNLVCAAEP